LERVSVWEGEEVNAAVNEFTVYYYKPHMDMHLCGQ
jgi:hypothetical protein